LATSSAASASALGRKDGGLTRDEALAHARLIVDAIPFVLTARALQFTHRRPSLNDTISRLRAFEKAGADVLFAPGLPDLAAVRAVCTAVSKPINFLVGIRGKSKGPTSFPLSLPNGV